MNRTDEQDSRGDPNRPQDVVSLQVELPTIYSLDALKLRLARQVAPWRWQVGLQQVADSVERGTPLDQAVKTHGKRMPAELRCMLEQALLLPDPGQFLVATIRSRSQVREAWRELGSLIVYPLCLLVIAFVVGGMFHYFLSQAIDFNWVDDFGLMNSQDLISPIVDQQNAMWGLAAAAIWTVFIAITVTLFGPSWAWLAILGGLRVIGRPYRWISLRELVERYRIVYQQDCHGVAAANLVAASLLHSRQAAAAKAIAERQLSGIPLGQALADSMLADGLCRPALRMLDEPLMTAAGRSSPAVATSSLNDRLLRTATLLERLSTQRLRELAQVLPVLVLIVVGTILWSLFSTYLGSMAPLIRMLSVF